jgi:dienelactone hydrolase
MGRPVLFTVYPGAHHGFDNPAAAGGRNAFGYTTYYDRAATADSEKRVRAFLAAPGEETTMNLTTLGAIHH